MQFPDAKGCAALHMNDAIYRKLSDMQEYLAPKSHMYALAWGANYPQQTLEAIAKLGGH